MIEKTSLPPKNAARNIRRLGVAVVIVTILYSTGWFFVASKFRDYAGQFLAKGMANVEITCPDFDTGGFPFLIGFNCSRSGVMTQNRDTEINAGAIRAAARIYDPGSAVIELDGPSDGVIDNSASFAARWKKMRGFVRAGWRGLNSISLQATDADFEVNFFGEGLPVSAMMTDGQLHMRDQDDNLGIAALARDLRLVDVDSQELLPKLSSSVELTVFGEGNVLQGKPFGGKALKGHLDSFKLEAAGGIYGEMSGNFSVDEDGYISGIFSTRLEKISLWSKNLKEIFPEAESTIGTLEALLKGLAKGNDEVTVNLRVDKGAISLSMLPLGQIPPL